MKYLSMVFFAFTAMIMLASPGVMAKPNAVTDVNNSCEYDVFTDFEPDCDGCHISTGGLTFWGETYLTEGACGLCTSSCSETTEEQLLKDAKNTTNAYFETLFRKFIMAMKGTGMMDEDGNITNPNIFAAVFPRCPELGPAIASEFSRDTGYLVRRVTTRTRTRGTPRMTGNWNNSRNSRIWRPTKPPGPSLILPNRMAAYCRPRNMKYLKW